MTEVTEWVERDLSGILHGVLPTSTYDRVKRDIIESHIEAGIKNILSIPAIKEGLRLYELAQGDWVLPKEGK